MSVPATITQAKDLREGLVDSDFSPLTDGYEAARVSTTYAGVAQRWLVIRSEAARERNRSTAERQLLKASEEERKRFDKLCQQAFSCVEDAQGAIARFEKGARVLDVIEHDVVEQRHVGKRGRPAKDAVPERITFVVTGVLAASVTLLEERIERASRFILATNDVSGEVLTDAEVLQAY